METTPPPARRSLMSDAKRDEVLGQYRASGLTQRAFCEQIGLPVSTLQWWLIKRRRAARPPRPAITFAEVPTPVITSASWAVEIASPTGWVLRFRDPQPAAALRTWLDRE